MYKVTLSMPIYNVAPYVERALLSALNQTFESIEFLLVDDRGTDNSMEIVRRIIKDHPRGKDVRIIEHPHNIGTGATKNTAIDNAQGEYLFFMDSDDEITQDCIEILYNKMMEEKVEMVVANYSIPPNFVSNVQNLTLNGNIIDYVYKKKYPFYIYTWNKLYDLSFLRKYKIRCIPYHNCEDNIFSFQVLLNLSSISFISQCTYTYYQYETSFMGVLRTIGFTERTAYMHADIIDYKVNVCLKNHYNKLDYIYTSVYFESIRYMIRVINSNLDYNLKIKSIDKLKRVNVLHVNLKTFTLKQKIMYILLSSINNSTLIFFLLKAVSLFHKIENR